MILKLSWQLKNDFSEVQKLIKLIILCIVFLTFDNYFGIEIDKSIKLFGIVIIKHKLILKAKNTLSNQDLFCCSTCHKY